MTPVLFTHNHLAAMVGDIESAESSQLPSQQAHDVDPLWVNVGPTSASIAGQHDTDQREAGSNPTKK